MPTKPPRSPRYRSQPETHCCSTATRTPSEEPSTCARYAASGASNRSQHGMDTTAVARRACNCSRAQCDYHFRAGGQQRRRRAPPRPRPAHRRRGRPGARGFARRTFGSAWRANTSATGPPAVLQRRSPSTRRPRWRRPGAAPACWAWRAARRGSPPAGGWAVAADADGVVAEHELDRQAHQRGHAHGRALVVGEGEVGHRQRHHAAMRGHAVGHRAHHVFAHAAVHVGAAPVGDA